MKLIINSLRSLPVYYLLFLIAGAINCPGQPVIPPPNTPAELVYKGDSVKLIFNGTTIFRGAIHGNDNPYTLNEKHEEINGKTYQTIMITSSKAEPLELTGELTGSDQSFACEADPPDGLEIVRHVVGASYSLRNRAIYDRIEDWLFSVDENGVELRLIPAQDTGRVRHYTLTAKGSEIALRFRPLFYHNHRMLSYFEPWTYRVWQASVNGWCSWFAYYDDIDEQKIRHAADVISEKLEPFGLEYLQIDDGYQQSPIGLPDTWLTANNKFPGGLKKLADYITQKGLKPGIWTNVSFADSAAAFANKDLFVTDSNGNPVSGRWIGYPLDGSNPEAINRIIRPVYEGFGKMGWQYFKLDALRHLKYEGYNSHADYFAAKNTGMNAAYRNVVSTVRETIGRDQFLLGCWGIRPELIGLIDGCRIGTDGFSYAGLVQFNSFNNVIWRNDPDHIELSRNEAYRSCTATSLTGSLFMLTDKPEVYETPLAEAAKRTIPVPVTVPGQVYDVDPSRSVLIDQADIEMSGSGPRVFDAGTTTTTGLFLLEVNKQFDRWMVLGRLDDRDPVIPFHDLGLENNKQYLVFEFWKKEFRGIFTGRFSPGPIDTAFNCQVFCIREKLARPQLLATNRHISCGNPDLLDLKWSDNTLLGSSQLVANDEYILYIFEPELFIFQGFKCYGADLQDIRKNGNIREISIRSVAGGKADWKVLYGN